MKGLSTRRYDGHAGRPGAFGSPVFTKFSQYPEAMFRNPLVVGGDEPGKCMEIVEDVEDFSGMKGAGVLARPALEPAFRGQRRPIEAKAKDLGTSRFPLRLEPCPCRMDDGQVTTQRPRASLVEPFASAGVVAERFL